jgi:predicted amidophosphoribosyltransferase
MTTNANHGVRDSGASPAATFKPGEYRLPFAACYVYSPKGESDVSQRSRQLCARVKSGSTKWLRTYASSVHQEVTRGRRFLEFFTEHTMLVPIPEYRASGRSTFWAARRLALALEDTGLGQEVWTGLRRISSVEKSASAWMWERPTVAQHYHSFAAIPSSRPVNQIVLIDDVVTKGRTLAAAALRLQDAFPKAEIRAFALVRTMGFVLDVARLFDPCQGEIYWDGSEAHRNP